MKTLILGFVAAASLSTAAMAGEKTDAIKVSGWHCANCASKTETALKGVKGVKKVTSDREKSEIRVTYDDHKVKRAQLDKAIADSGFTAEN